MKYQQEYGNQGNSTKILLRNSKAVYNQNTTDRWIKGDILLFLLKVNADKTEYMCSNQKGDISTLNCGTLKLVKKFTYLGSSFSSTENNISTLLAKAWTAIDRLLVRPIGYNKKQFFPSSGPYYYMDTLFGR